MFPDLTPMEPTGVGRGWLAVTAPSPPRTPRIHPFTLGTWCKSPQRSGEVENTPLASRQRICIFGRGSDFFFWLREKS